MKKKWIALVVLLVIALIAGGVVLATRTQISETPDQTASSSPSVSVPVVSDTPTLTQTTTPAQQTPKPTADVGKTRDNPIPLGYSRIVKDPTGGRHEVTVLDAGFLKGSIYGSSGSLLVKVKIKALETTNLNVVREQRLVGKKGKVYSGAMGTSYQDLLAGTSKIVIFYFDADPDDSDYVLIWQPLLSDPCFFSLGEVLTKSGDELRKGEGEVKFEN